MASVNVGVGIAKPTHELGLSHGGDAMGFGFENGNLSMIETPLSTQPLSFQWSQNTWVGGRGNSRSANDQTGFFDSGGMWTLTPDVLHLAPQWNQGNGFYFGESYLPTSRQITWKPLRGETKTIAFPFVAASSYSIESTYVYIRAIGRPSSLFARLSADVAGDPGTTVIVSSEITIADLNYDSLSRWTRFKLPALTALTSGTKYWIQFESASDEAGNHWQIGGQSEIGRGCKYISAVTIFWTAFSDEWRVFYRNHELHLSPTKVSSFELYTASYICASYLSTTRLYVNGGLCKASAGSTNTITTTPDTSWAAANQFTGAKLRIVAGTGIGTRPVTILTHTIGAGAVITITGVFDITPDATSIFVIYDTPVWTQITGHGITKVLKSDAAVLNNTAYFPQGAATNMRRMYFDTTTGAYVFADDGTNKANFIHSFKGYLWRTLDGAANCAASFAPSVAVGTDLTFGTDIVIGSSNYPVTNLKDHADSIYVFKYDNVYQITNGASILINFGLNKFPSENNGKSVVSSGSSLYFSVLQGMERYTNGTVDDIGWNRHEGLPPNRNGFATSAMVYGSWIIVTVDAGTGGESSILVWNGQGWHEIFRAFDDDHGITMAMMTSPNRMWFFMGDDAFYMDMPDNIVNPLHATSMRYIHEGYLTTSTIDMNKISFKKIFRDVLVQTSGLASNTYIYVDYQVDDGIGAEQWYVDGGKYSPPLSDSDLVTFIPAVGERMLTSPFDSLEINRGNVRQIRLRFRFAAEQDYFPAVLYDAQLNGVVIEPSKYQWNFTGTLSSNRVNDFKPDDLVEWVKDAARNMRLLQAHSSRKTLDNRWVYISQPTVIRTSETNQNGKWDGRISFTLREP